jgi:uncharacterized spore protein YtfJ
MKVFDQIREVVTGTAVFGQPYEKNGVTVIPASKVTGGGGGGETATPEEAGGGGVGVDARPAGAFVITGNDVRWIPAFDLNRVILMGQLLAIVAVLSWRSVAKARARSARAR